MGFLVVAFSVGVVVLNVAASDVVGLEYADAKVEERLTSAV